MTQSRTPVMHPLVMGLVWFRPEDYDLCLKLFVDGKVRRTYEGIFDEVDVYHMVMDELARDS